MTPSPQMIVHVVILQDTFSDKNIGSEISQWQFITDIFTLSITPTKTDVLLVLNPLCIIQGTFHHHNITDGQMLQPMLMLPMKGCLPAMHMLMFYTAYIAALVWTEPPSFPQINTLLLMRSDSEGALPVIQIKLATELTTSHFYHLQSLAGP